MSENPRDVHLNAYALVRAHLLDDKEAAEAIFGGMDQSGLQEVTDHLAWILAQHWIADHSNSPELAAEELGRCMREAPD